MHTISGKIIFSHCSNEVRAACGDTGCGSQNPASARGSLLWQCRVLAFCDHFFCRCSFCSPQRKPAVPCVVTDMHHISPSTRGTVPVACGLSCCHLAWSSRGSSWRSPSAGCHHPQKTFACVQGPAAADRQRFLKRCRTQ